MNRYLVDQHRRQQIWIGIVLVVLVLVAVVIGVGLVQGSSSHVSPPQMISIF